MKRVALVVGICFLLGACSLPQIAAKVSTAALSPATMQTIANVCRQGEPFVQIAAVASSISIKEIASFITAYCEPLLAGSVPATTDSNTVSWLQKNLNSLRALLGR